MATVFFDKAVATAVSTIVAGNTGITPFLTLFLVGVIEHRDPDVLNMEHMWDGKLETILASTGGLAIFGLATMAEFVSTCVPVVDEFWDGIMTFIIPFISVLGSTATFGLFSVASDVIDGQSDDEERRSRKLDIGDDALVAFQIFLAAFGVVLALVLHFFKMLIRLLGEGWATGCITVLEFSWTCISIFVAVFIQPISIVFAICLCLVAIYGFRRVYRKRKERKAQQQQEQQGTNSAGNDGDAPPAAVPPPTATNSTQPVTHTAATTGVAPVPYTPEGKVTTNMNDTPNPPPTAPHGDLEESIPMAEAILVEPSSK